jgi:hypothetical protein
MLPVIIRLIDTLRRALKRGGRHLLQAAEVLQEARIASRKYPFAE